MLEPLSEDLAEPNRCYVCLEECDTTSPCECHMYVHEPCLAQAHHVSQRNNCSICHSPIQVKSFHFFPVPPNVYIGTAREAHDCTGTTVGAGCYFFALYLLFGWIGKLLAYGIGFQINPNWAVFWSFEHFVAFICSFVIVSCIYNTVKKIC